MATSHIILTVYQVCSQNSAIGADQVDGIWPPVGQAVGGGSAVNASVVAIVLCAFCLIFAFIRWQKLKPAVWAIMASLLCALAWVGLVVFALFISEGLMRPQGTVLFLSVGYMFIFAVFLVVLQLINIGVHAFQPRSTPALVFLSLATVLSIVVAIMWVAVGYAMAYCI